MCRDKAMLLWCCLICIFTHLFAILHLVCVYLYTSCSGAGPCCWCSLFEKSTVMFLWKAPGKSTLSLLICFGAWAGLKKTEMEGDQLHCGWTASSSVKQTSESENSDKKMKERINCLPLRVWMKSVQLSECKLNQTCTYFKRSEQLGPCLTAGFKWSLLLRYLKCSLMKCCTQDKTWTQ